MSLLWLRLTSEAMDPPREIAAIYPSTIMILALPAHVPARAGGLAACLEREIGRKLIPTTSGARGEGGLGWGGALEKAWKQLPIPCRLTKGHLGLRYASIGV